MLSKREAYLLRLPHLIVFLYIVICAVGLRAFDSNGFFPFNRWNMFSIRPKSADFYYIEVNDFNGKFICNLIRCPGLYPAYRRIEIKKFINELGDAKSEADKEKYRDLILSEIQSNISLRFVVKRIHSDGAIPASMIESGSGEAIVFFELKK